MLGVVDGCLTSRERTTPCFPVHAALSDTHHTVMKVWHDGQQSSRGVCRLMTSRVHCWEAISAANWGSGVIPQPVRVSLFWPMQQIFGRFVTVDKGGGEGLNILVVLEEWSGLSIYPDRLKLWLCLCSKGHSIVNLSRSSLRLKLKSWFILTPENLVFPGK